MKREIKFRCWQTSGLYSTKEKMISFLRISETWSFYEFLNPLKKGRILMQYIGLKDKKGREIYEGDILQEDYGKKRLYKVFSVNGGFAINQFQDDFNKENIVFYESTADMQNASFIESSLIIIGNIYETPNLLPND
jgi:uncharacterized phage protein (TIGR01671 family)